jgi:pterin-4a-carbinolamine dehydratase
VSELARRKCRPCVKVYPFTNYYQTMAFVNALAWSSRLSENDFICAARADALSHL